MPNHFHFILTPNENACKQIIMAEKTTEMQYLSKQIGITLSSYTKAINNQNNTSGNLFQKKTKAKCLHNRLQDTLNYQAPESAFDYLTNCFLYVHQNPLKAGLVKNLKDWPYSSWPDYAGLRNGGLCNQEKLFQLTGLSKYDCIDQNILLNEDAIKNIF